jgi:hypothetical protein
VISGSQAEHLIDEPVLHPNVTVPHPPNLTLPNLVHGFVTLNRPPCTAELTNMLLGADPSLDGTVILLEDVVEILNRPILARENAWRSANALYAAGFYFRDLRFADSSLLFRRKWAQYALLR